MRILALTAAALALSTEEAPELDNLVEEQEVEQPDEAPELVEEADEEELPQEDEEVEEEPAEEEEAEEAEALGKSAWATCDLSRGGLISKSEIKSCIPKIFKHLAGCAVGRSKRYAHYLFKRAKYGQLSQSAFNRLFWHFRSNANTCLYHLGKRGVAVKYIRY